MSVAVPAAVNAALGPYLGCLSDPWHHITVSNEPLVNLTNRWRDSLSDPAGPLRSTWDPFGEKFRSNFSGLAALYFIGLFSLLGVTILYIWVFPRHGKVQRVVASWAGLVPCMASTGCCFFSGVGGIFCICSFTLTTFSVQSADYLIARWYENVTSPVFTLPDLSFSKITGGIMPGSAPLATLPLLDANSLKMVDTFIGAASEDVSAFEAALGVNFEAFLPLEKFASEFETAFASIKNQHSIPPEVIAALALAGQEYATWSAAIAQARTIPGIFGGHDVAAELQAFIDHDCPATWHPSQALRHAELVALAAKLQEQLDATADLPVLPAALPAGLGDLDQVVADGIGEIVAASVAFIRKIWPVARTLNPGNLIAISNWFQNVFLWGFGQWGACASIAGFFAILGCVVMVLELWLRRVGMMLRSELTIKTTFSYSDGAEVKAPLNA
jgi:hypothetical protein